MFFNSIKEINRIRKEVNRLSRKGISNIYLKVTIEKNWGPQNFDFLNLKSLFTPTHLTQILLNFKTCCNLKIRGLGARLCDFSIRPR